MTTATFSCACAALLLAIGGCGNSTSGATSHAPAPVADVHSDGSATTGTGNAIEPPLLADDIADDRTVSDTDDADATEAEESGVDVLAENAGAVKFVPVATTSLAVTAEDQRYMQQIEQRQMLASAAPATTSSTEDAPANADVGSQTQHHADATPPPAPAATPPDEQQILKDRKGQWAVSARASSTYAQSPGDKAPYSAWQATGAPNVLRYADDGAAWASRSGDARDPEWLEVTFARPVHATSIRIRQNTAPGAISGIELIDEQGNPHSIWAGTDDTVYPKNTIGWLIRDTPRTDFRIKGARITLMTARVWGWNEIDAVQLVGEP